MSGPRSPRSVLAALSLALVGCLLGATVAFGAGASRVKLMPVSRSAGGAVALARSMMADPRQLIGAQFLISPPQNQPRLIGSGPRGALDGFPLHAGQFGILTNGCGNRVDQPRFAGSFGCNDRGLEFDGTRDTTVFRVELSVPRYARCLSFRFRFLSNEYPKWVGSQYNDAFIAEQGYYARWRSSFQNPRINVPDDFATTRDGKLITINQTGFAAVSRRAARGTGYDAATRILRASTPVRPGRRYVVFSLFDQSDRQFDSTVFIDRLTLDRRSPCTSGVSIYN